MSCVFHGLRGGAERDGLGERPDRQLRHVRLADDDRAGLAQPRDDVGVDGPRAGVRRAAPARRLAGDVGVVLDRDRDAEQRALLAGAAAGVGLVGLGERALGEDDAVGVELRIDAVRCARAWPRRPRGPTPRPRAPSAPAPPRRHRRDRWRPWWIRNTSVPPRERHGHARTERHRRHRRRAARRARARGRAARRPGARPACRRSGCARRGGRRRRSRSRWASRRACSRSATRSPPWCSRRSRLLVALADLSALAPIRRLTPARATQNVVSRARARCPPGAITLIVTAAVDRARSGLARRFPGGVLRWSLGALALVLACCVVRAAGIEETWVGARAARRPRIVLLACLLAFLDEAVADPVDDDRGAVARGAGADRRARRGPAGAPRRRGRPGRRGRRPVGRPAGLAARPPRPRPGARATSRCSTWSPSPSEAPGWWARDGVVVTSALHPQLLRAARAAAAAEPDLERPCAAPPARHRGGASPAPAAGPRSPSASAIRRRARGSRSALVRALDAELDGIPPHEAVQSTDPA